MYKSLKGYWEFQDQVGVLRLDDYSALELEEFPCSPAGGFWEARIDAMFRLLRLHPEYHVVSCVAPHLYVNAFIGGAQAYYLASGDPDPNLIYDPRKEFDAHFIYSLNSGSNRRRP
jgi:hypothetical protein